MARKPIFSKKSTAMTLTPNCSKCGRFANCDSPKQKGRIVVDSKVCFVLGKPVSDTSHLRNLIDVFDGSSVDHAVACDNGEKITPPQVDACRPLLMNSIRKAEPSVIIPLGKTATRGVLGGVWAKKFGDIDKWRGFHIPFRRLNAWVCPVVSAEFLRRMEKKPQHETVFHTDLENALTMIDVPLPRHPVEDVEVIVDEDKALSRLKDILVSRPKYLAFDYETSGLKPYNKGHFIYTVSFCCERGRAFAIPFRESCHDIVRKILTDERIGKIAANMKHERKWTKRLLGYEVKPLVFDTMLAAHFLDQREGITGLKFQAFARLGVEPYDEAVEKFWSKSGSNEINKIREAPKKELLKYNGMDSLLEYELAMIQMKEMKR